MTPNAGIFFVSSIKRKRGSLMKKLAILFPGIGYTCVKPLLYYTGSLAAELGYEVLRLDYGQDIHTFRGRTPEEMRPIQKLALKRTLDQLEKVPFQEYESLLFISKSIGTVVACKTEIILQLSDKTRHFLMTPIPDTLPYLKDVNGIFLSGTGDPYISADLVRNAASSWPEKTGGIFEGCNHSLEKPGDIMEGLKNLTLVCTCLKEMLTRPLST